MLTQRSCEPRARFSTCAFLLLALLLSVCLAAPAQQGMFGSGEYARDRDYDLQHIRLDLSFDFPNKKIMGTATLRLEPLGSGLREVTLDSAVNVESVAMVAAARGAKPLPLTYRTGDEKLIVALDKPYSSGTKFELAIKYNAQPKKGLFFVMPDKNYPDRPSQIWSQGEAMDNHHWFPCYDFPNDRVTTEMRVTVPAKWEVVSNGRLVSVEEDRAAGTRAFHWLQDQPHSTYLVSIVAGDFEKVEERVKSVNNLLLSYYVPPKTSSDALVAFGRTPDMIQFFSEKIVPYPWPKYAQSAVEDFVAGGMENTSATTVHRGWLVEKELAKDIADSTDDGIAHELAHQWFGDLLTTADWRNLWLNEGFATYFANLWGEHHFGRDRFDWDMLRTARQITSVPNIQNFPIVWRANEAAGPYQTLIYPKGGFVLHMMRHQLGDELWWKAIRHYVQKFRYQNVQTHDFVEAVAEATGHNFEYLFAQYVYGPGHPEFELSWDYEAKTHLVHVVVNQTLKRNDKPAPFRVPVDFELLDDAGAKTYTVWVSKETEHLYFPAEQRPRTVLFDPNNGILKTATFKKDEAEWLWQLEHAPRALNREEAAFALRKLTATPAVLAALEHAGTADKFEGVRVEAAQTLGELKAEASRVVLLKMAADPEPQVRRTAVQTLGRLKADDATNARLLGIARSDSSLQTRAAAINAYGAFKPKNAIEALLPLMEVNSARETVRQAALAAIARQEDEKAVPVLLDCAKPGKPASLRQAAMRGLANLGKGKPDVKDLLVEALKDSQMMVRMSALNTLSQRRETSAADAIEQMAAVESVSYLASMARRTADSLRSGTEMPGAGGRGGAGRGGPAAGGPSGSAAGDTTQLQKRIDDLEKENREMKARLERLEKAR